MEPERRSAAVTDAEPQIPDDPQVSLKSPHSVLLRDMAILPVRTISLMP